MPSVPQSRARRLVAGEIGQNGLATDGGLPDDDERLGVAWQIDVQTAAEADQSIAFAGTHLLAVPQRRDDTAGNQPRDLHEGNFLAVFELQPHGRALVDVA